MDRKQRSLLGLRASGALVALGLLAWTFRELDWGRVSAVLDGLGAPALLLVPLPMGAALLVESFGWARAFRRFGRELPFWGLFRVRVSSEALALTLPAGMLFGESLKPFLLARHCRLPLEASLAGMAVRKHLLLLSQAVYIGCFAVLGAPYLERASQGSFGAGLVACLLAAALACALLAVGSAMLLARGRLAERLLGALSRLPLAACRGLSQRAGARCAAADGALARFFAGSTLGAALPGLGFLVGWFCEAAETYLLLRLLGLELPFAAVGACEVAMSFLRHVTFVLPAGLGVQDLGYVAALRALGVADPLAVGAAFVLLKRGKEMVWAVVGFTLLAADLRPRAARSAGAGRAALQPASGAP